MVFLVHVYVYVIVVDVHQNQSHNPNTEMDVYALCQHSELSRGVKMLAQMLSKREH